MRRNWYCFVSVWTHCLVGILLWSACADSRFVTPEPEVSVTLSLNVPGNGVPQTRMTDAQQQLMKGLRVLVFSGNGGYRYDAPISELTGSSITVRLLPNTGGETSQLVLLANAPTPSASPTVGDPKADVLRKFVFACSGVWAHGASDAKPLPMWGETNAVAVGENTVLADKAGGSSIQLVRALARVDVGIDFTTLANPAVSTANGLGNFTLKSVRVFNSKNSGYIAAGTSSPHLPSTVAGWGNNVSNPLEYALTAAETNSNSYCGNIFLPEAAAGSSAEDANAVFLVIGGCYDGSATETFYRVGFIDSGNVPLAILRNYLYRVNITRVSSAGFGTVDEAKQSAPANMTATVVGWNNAAMNEMVYDGQNFFTCASKKVVLFYNANSTVSVPVASNILASEWTITNSGTSSGRVQVTKPGNGSPGAQGGNLVFKATGQGGTSGLGAGDVVTVTVKVKNLEMVFSVRQVQSDKTIAAPGDTKVPDVNDYTTSSSSGIPGYGYVEPAVP